MTTSLTRSSLIAAIVLATLVLGCGSSENMIPLQTHLSMSDSLRKEIGSLTTQNVALNARLARLEDDKRLQMTRIAELESTVTFLKHQIAKTPPPPAVDPRLAYQHALELFRGKNYGEALTTFQSLLDGGIEPKLQDNCRYWIGECLFGSKEYTKAIGHFQQVFAFEHSEKKDESQMMIARSYAAIGNAGQAKIEYQKLIDTYPASPYLKRAKEQMARIR